MTTQTETHVEQIYNRLYYLSRIYWRHQDIQEKLKEIDKLTTELENLINSKGE